MTPAQQATFKAMPADKQKQMFKALAKVHLIH